MSKTKASKTETPKAPETPPEMTAIVLVPADVFSEVMKILAGQPYKEVGVLMNTLGGYTAQMVRVAPRSA